MQAGTTKSNPCGKAKRFATHAAAVRVFRTDHEGEAALHTLRAILRGHNEKDVTSVSLVLRRALEIYRDHVQAMTRNPLALANEKAAVRRHSTMPSGARRRKPSEATAKAVEAV